MEKTELMGVTERYGNWLRLGMSTITPTQLRNAQENKGEMRVELMSNFDKAMLRSRVTGEILEACWTNKSRAKG